MRNIALPLGISFYTFQALSYVIDLYRGEIKVQKNWFLLALYVSFFPQLIAGPIVRYADVEEQLARRTETAMKAAVGIKRFLYGLAKKVLLANTFALAADEIFGLAARDAPTAVAWAGAVFYALQIYYDFSGYSDMAIGLGASSGFTSWKTSTTLTLPPACRSSGAAGTSRCPPGSAAICTSRWAATAKARRARW
ncbi:MAG: MBOAT family O-acyltransferase [Ruthenibacterium sp.]